MAATARVIDCSPRARSGHTVAEPATILMKSRRLMSIPMAQHKTSICSNEGERDIKWNLRFGPFSSTLHPGDRRQGRRRGERRIGPDDDGLALHTAPVDDGEEDVVPPVRTVDIARPAASLRYESHRIAPATSTHESPLSVRRTLAVSGRSEQREPRPAAAQCSAARHSQRPFVWRIDHPV